MFALIDKNGNIRSRLDEYGNPIAFYDGLDPKGVQMIKEDIAILLKE
jgi:protein SCO1/2